MAEAASVDVPTQWAQLDSESRETSASRCTARLITLSKWIGALLLVIFLCCWFNPFRGGKSAHVLSHDVVISLDGSQFSYGPETLFAFAGQTLTISSNSKIEHGYLDIYVWRHELLPPTSAAPPLRKLSIHADSQVSQHDIRIDRTGFYRIDIMPMRERNRYDITYDLSWRLH